MAAASRSALRDAAKTGKTGAATSPVIIEERVQEKPKAPSAAGKKPGQDAALFGSERTAQAMEKAALVLSAPDVPGKIKRRITGLVMEEVARQKTGADVYFRSGFGPSGGDLNQTWQSEQVAERLDAESARPGKGGGLEPRSSRVRLSYHNRI